LPRFAFDVNIVPYYGHNDNMKIFGCNFRLTPCFRAFLFKMTIKGVKVTKSLVIFALDFWFSKVYYMQRREEKRRNPSKRKRTEEKHSNPSKRKRTASTPDKTARSLKKR